MRKGALFLLALATTALAQVGEEETPTPPIDPKIDFKVSVVGKRNEFHIGEIIPIELFFSCRLRHRFQINEAQYDRSGRMDYEKFVVTPADGVEDPLAEYFSPDSVHIGGGLTGESFLSARPWAIRLDLNEWVRFTKAGEYRLRVFSHRVDRVEGASPNGTSPVTAISNEIAFKILPRDSAWEKRALDQAVAILRNPITFKDFRLGGSPRARHAFRTLRFLDTADAARELVNQLGRKTSDGFGGTCFFGVVYSPERAAARAALKEALTQPDRPIDDNFIDTLIAIENRNEKNKAATMDNEEKVLEKVARVLPEKRGEAFPLSLYSLSNYFWVRGGRLLPKDTVDRLVEQLLAIFDQLTPEQRDSLLGIRWEEIKRPSLVPLLKRCAEQDSSGPQQDIHYNARTLAALALRRWFELDPTDARPAIIREISRAKPRFGVRELGILPDQTLPEIDRLLAEHFHGDEDFETASNFAALIGRYGSREILPQVLQKLDASIGKWSCAVQNPLLAYVLRVDPESARSRLEKAIVKRDKENMCNGSFFSEIAAIHYDPLLEEVAIRALDNPDDTFASGAAGMLAAFGSSASEAALWKCYEKWCKRWAGHEAQINLEAVSAHIMEERRTENLSLGRSLGRAIAEGDGWLTDETKLQRLKAMSKVPTIQADMDRYLEHWHRSALTLMISSCGPTRSAQPDVADLIRFSASVAHYRLDSREALKEKLSQFPRSTKFEFWRPSDKTDQGCIDDLRAFLTSHEFSVTDARIDERN
jgi:hypothetical protein